MAKIKEIFNLKNPTTRRTLLTGLAFIAGFSVLAIISIQGWEYSNSVAFCSTTCHDVHPEEPLAFQDSYHARVKCTECHMGRVSVLEAIVLKTSHFRHGPEVIFDNYERPLESATMRPVNESCERCHWPPAFHGDTVREIVSFGSDKENTEERTYLILKTGGGERDAGLGFGIHWHIANQVEYIATDEHKQDIRWVRSTLPDGRTVVFEDLTDPLSRTEFVKAEIQVMDCVDCHNRVGHPFPYPDQAIDQAMAEGRLSSELPYAKAWMSTLLNADYPGQEIAFEEVTLTEEKYKEQFPEAAASYPAEIEQATKVALDLLPRLIFEEPGVTWESFPNNGQHKEFAGCFRCHDGKHQSSEGESIRLHCNICHSIPLTVGEEDRAPQMPVTTVAEPDSHLAPSFIADHRFQAGEECVACHGTVEFGSDDSSFCSNSSCHGQAWPSVELDAAFPHPIELAGKHAETWCHDCHQGVSKPEYVCSNCHEPPTDPHFGELCEDCHEPAGFSPANFNFEHPLALDGNHAELNCSACHDAGVDLTLGCAACHQPPARHLAGDCESCHAPVGFAESAQAIYGIANDIPHALEEMDECLLCHSPGGEAAEIPAGHEDYYEGQCTLCHKRP